MKNMETFTKCGIKTKLMALKELLSIVTWRFPPWEKVLG